MGKRVAIFCVALLTFLLLPAGASTNSIQVVFGGQPVSFEVPPVIRNGRTFVPVRFVLERIQAEVRWDAEARRVLIQRGSQLVVLTIDSPEVQANGKSVVIEAAPFIHDDRTMVPIRFLAETFGFGVHWDGTTSTVYLNPPEQAAEPGDHTQTASGDPAIILLGPEQVKVGETFTVTVRVENIQNAKGASVGISYDPLVLQAEQIQSGSLIEGLSAAKEIDHAAGRIRYVTAIPGTRSYTGSGTYFAVVFRAVAPGSVVLEVSPAFEADALLMNSQLEPLPVVVRPVSVKIEI